MANIHAVTMPKWGLEMTEGTVTKWHLTEGQAGAKGGDLADIETAKIVNTVQLEFDGAIRRLVAKPGDTLPVGALIAIVSDSGISEAEIDTFVNAFKPIDLGIDSASAEESPAPAPAPSPAPAAVVPSPAVAASPTTLVAASPALSPAEAEAKNASISASPIARRLANKLGIDLTHVKGTGSHGRVSQEDVEAEVARLKPAAAPVAAPVAAAPERGPDEIRAGPAARKLAAEMGIDLASQVATGPKNVMLKEDVLRGAQGHANAKPGSSEEFDLIPLTPMRKAIAAVLVRAKQTIPHFYLSVDFEMDKLIALRAEINRQRGEGEKLSVTDFLLRATALALAAVPDVNIHFIDAGIKRFKSVNLSLAVAIDGGLMTPVIKDSANKSLSQLSKEAALIAKAARARTLTNEDMANGSFTISNLGMFGIHQFDAVINPPQGAILATGKVRREAYEGENGAVLFRSVMSATLSCDHRAIDGALGAKFLAALGAKIANPLSLLL